MAPPYPSVYPLAERLFLRVLSTISTFALPPGPRLATAPPQPMKPALPEELLTSIQLDRVKVARSLRTPPPAGMSSAAEEWPLVIVRLATVTVLDGKIHNTRLALLPSKASLAGPGPTMLRLLET